MDREIFETWRTPFLNHLSTDRLSTDKHGQIILPCLKIQQFHGLRGTAKKSMDRLFCHAQKTHYFSKLEHGQARPPKGGYKNLSMLLDSSYSLPPGVCRTAHAFDELGGCARARLPGQRLLAGIRTYC